MTAKVPPPTPQERARWAEILKNYRKGGAYTVDGKLPTGLCFTTQWQGCGDMALEWPSVAGVSQQRMLRQLGTFRPKGRTVYWWTGPKADTIRRRVLRALAAGKLGPLA